MWSCVTSHLPYWVYFHTLLPSREIYLFLIDFDLFVVTIKGESKLRWKRSENDLEFENTTC